MSQHGGLKFNDPQSWGYEIIVSESDITLLRDHIRLIVDLIVDWQWQNATDKVTLSDVSDSLQAAQEIRFNSRNGHPHAHANARGKCLYQNGAALFHS